MHLSVPRRAGFLLTRDAESFIMKITHILGGVTMKLINKVVTVVSSIAAVAMFASCASTGGATAAAEPAPAAESEAPAAESEAESPTFVFEGNE